MEKEFEALNPKTEHHTLYFGRSSRVTQTECVAGGTRGREKERPPGFPGGLFGGSDAELGGGG